METILRKLIYAIEGYVEPAEMVITYFRQDTENPNRYYLEIEDRRHEAEKDKSAASEEGAGE